MLYHVGAWQSRTRRSWGGTSDHPPRENQVARSDNDYLYDLNSRAWMKSSSSMSGAHLYHSSSHDPVDFRRTFHGASNGGGSMQIGGGESSSTRGLPRRHGGPHDGGGRGGYGESSSSWSPGMDKIDEDEAPFRLPMLAASARGDTDPLLHTNRSSVMQTSYFWLKQRKYQRRADFQRKRLGGAQGIESTTGQQASLSRSFSQTGRKTSTDKFSATDSIDPRHWEMNPDTHQVSRATQRQLQMMAVRRAFDHDEAYQKEIKARWKRDTDDFNRNQKLYDERLVLHVFAEIQQNTLEGNQWRQNVPPQFIDATMAPRHPTFKHETPPALRELITYWWKRAGALGPPSLPPGPSKKKKEGEAVVGEEGKSVGPDGKKLKAKVDPDRNLAWCHGSLIDTCGTTFQSEDAYRALQVIHDYNACSFGLAMTPLHKERLTRHTFCRFLLDCEIVELDGQTLIKECAKSGRIGMLYACNLFDSYVTYDSAAIDAAHQRQLDRKTRLERIAAKEAKRKQFSQEIKEGGLVAAAGGDKAASGGNVSPGAAGTAEGNGGGTNGAGAKAMENKSTKTVTYPGSAAYQKQKPKDETESSQYLGTISILEDFLPLLQKILNIVNSVDFFTDYLERAAERIGRIKDQREDFIQSLSNKFHSDGLPLNPAHKKPIKRKFYPQQNLSYRVDPVIFNAAIRKLDQASSMDVAEMVNFHVSANSVLIRVRQMMCEPEVWFWMWQWQQVFDELFDAFADFPTDLLGWREGHMSFGAFLRFCVDFKFFPHVLSYADLFAFYHSAECCVFKEGDLDSGQDPELRRHQEMMQQICQYEERKKVEDLAELHPVLPSASPKKKTPARQPSASPSSDKKSKNKSSPSAQKQAAAAAAAANDSVSIVTSGFDTDRDGLNPLEGGGGADAGPLPPLFENSDVVAVHSGSAEAFAISSPTSTSVPNTAASSFPERSGAFGGSSSPNKQVAVGGGGAPVLGAAARNLRAEQEAANIVAAREMDRDTFWTKSFEEMTKMEYETWHVLAALDGWLENRGGDIKKLFTLFDVDGTGEVSAEEFHLGLRQTRLEPLPPVEVVNQMFIMMDEDASGELSVNELYRILKRYREELAKKRALEDPTVDMSTDRGHTFLRIEDYGFSPAIVKPIKVQNPVGVGSSKSPGAIADGRASRASSVEEGGLQSINEQASTYAAAPAARSSSNSPPKSSRAKNKNVKQYRIFGKAAFQESLLKMTFYHLSLNGNQLQKNASAYVKGLWLIGYIRTEFQKFYSKIDDIIAEAVKQDDKLRVLLDKNEVALALKADETAPLKEMKASDKNNILYGEALGKVQQQQRAEKLYDQSTAERLLKLQKLICATKTSYVSPLTRLLRQRWDPFESVEVVKFESKEAWAARCPYCFEIPKRTNGGYTANIDCLGCSPLIMDVRRGMTDLPLWEAIRPFTWKDELRITGEKKRFRIVVGLKRPQRVKEFEG